MEIILSTAFGIKAETQTIENDPITELAKKAMAAHPIIGIMCRDLNASFKRGQLQRDYPVIQSFKLSLSSLWSPFFIERNSIVIYALCIDNEQHYHLYFFLSFL